MPAPKDRIKRAKWIKNMSNSQTGLKRSQKHKDNMSKAQTGKRRTQEHKDNISKALSGKNNPTFGRTGENNYKWKGEEYQETGGRWIIWVNNVRYRRARYIAMKCLGRKLVDNETIHHINEDPSDDRPENLYLFTNQSNHCSHHRYKITPTLISNLIT